MENRKVEAAVEQSERFSIAGITGLLRRWRWLLVAVTLVSVSIAYAILERVTPVYKATSTVIVSPKSPRILADIKDIVDVPDGSRRDFSEYIHTQLDIIGSQAVSANVLDTLDLWDDDRLFPSTKAESVDAEALRLKRSSLLANRIQARRVPESLIIEVQFEHEDPELAALIANTSAAEYVKQNLELKRRMLDRAGDQLQSLLRERVTAKDAAELSVRGFELEHNMAVVETRRKEVEGERAYYNQKVLEATAEVVSARAALSEIEEATGSGVYGLGIAQVLANSVLNSLKVQYMAVRNEVTELELVYGERHNKLIGAKRRLRQIRNAITRETQGLLAAARARLDAATAEQEELVARFEQAREEDESLGAALEEHARLTKTLTEQTELFDRIRKRFEETTITTSLADAANNVRILDEALVPTRAVWPRRMPVLGASVIFGLLLGVALVLLLERVDTTIRDKAHAERLLEVPCLGLVPTMSVPGGMPQVEGTRLRDLFVFENPLSEPAEQARTLRTNLLFLSAERKLKTLLVTSALPEEGKTTIALQTGTTLASAGGRTLLIEADMRRPRLAQTLGVPEEVGLSTYLADRDVEVATVVRRTHIPNLDVIVCGLIPPNPAELLNSLRLNQLLGKLNEQYDMIVIDSPPVNAVSDAMVMASRVDGVLLVAKSKRTTAEALRTAYRSLYNVDAPVIGTVLNDMRRGSMGYYKRGQYYRKGYYRRTESDENDHEQVGVG